MSLGWAQFKGDHGEIHIDAKKVCAVEQWGRTQSRIYLMGGAILIVEGCPEGVVEDIWDALYNMEDDSSQAKQTC